MYPQIPTEVACDMRKIRGESPPLITSCIRDVIRALKASTGWVMATSRELPLFKDAVDM